MWKKIHSNRDPRDTLFSEIRKEFGSYFFAAGNTLKRFSETYPKCLFGVMIFLLTFSLLLSLTVFQVPEPEQPAIRNNANPVETGFDQILQTTGNIKEILQLKNLVDSLSAKPHLTAKDSIQLNSALDRLSKIHQTLN